MSSTRALEKALSDAREGKLASALASVRTIVQCNPKDLEAGQVLASLLADAGQFTQAIHHFSRVIAIAETDARLRGILPPVRNNYANALTAIGRHAEAVAQWREALNTNPNFSVAYIGLTQGLIACGDAEGAIREGMKGLSLNPGSPQLVQNITNALEAAMRFDETIYLLRQSLAADPLNAHMHSRLLTMLNYVDCPLAESIAAHRAFLPCAAGSWRPAHPDRTPTRAVRIGILSGDMRTHSVAFFTLAWLQRRADVDALVVFSTGSAKDGDPMRAHFQRVAHDWVECTRASDEQIDQWIREKKIDVLLDLGAHTSGGRLLALNAGPAPVVITAIGYPNSTGHRAVGWRIVDSITDPPGAEEQSTERLLRIDPCFLCYTPPADAPLSAAREPSPAVAFGSFNLATKISPRCARLWASAMRAADEVAGPSTLLLKNAAMADPSSRERVLAMLETAGIARTRVELLPQTPTVAEHLALYARVDIALDTVPYNGTTTTCEALWMGVPTITLRGDRHAARVGASLLAACGHPEWCAESEESFAAVAKSLAANQPERARLRTSLRSEMASSPLCDSAAYAERFHAAIRLAWQAWCGGATALTPNR